MDEEEESDFETYLLLLLSDSNLPTGGFVASSGLESFYAHGLLHNSRPAAPTLIPNGSTSTQGANARRPVAPSQAQLSSATLSFAQSTLHSYARSSFPFIARVHACVNAYLDTGVRARLDRDRARDSETVEQERWVADRLFEEEEKLRLSSCLQVISHLDYSYHTLLLNHVARRASKAQGIALLTLYSKAFAKPIDLSREPFAGPLPSSSAFPSCSKHPAPASTNTSASEKAEKIRIELAAKLVDRLKLDIRKSSSYKRDLGGGQQPSWTHLGGQHGHLPICWAVFGACLGIRLKKAVFLHLFLQARSLFSSSIRLNTLGPYLAHQVMRFQMRGVVDAILQEMQNEGCLDVPIEAKKKQAEGGKKGSREEVVEREDEDVEMRKSVDVVEGYTIEDDNSPHPLPQQEQRKDLATTTSSMPSRPTKPFRTTKTMSTTSHPTVLARHALRPKVQALRVGKGTIIPVDDDDPTQGWAWDWPEEQDTLLSPPPLPPTTHQLGQGEQESQRDYEKGFWTTLAAPATTFPLGEIIQARHDQLHSRLFNS